MLIRRRFARALLRASPCVDRRAPRCHAEAIQQIVQDVRPSSVPRVPWRLMLATVAMIVRTYGPNYGREMLIEPVKAALHATFGGAYRFTRRSMATALRLVSSRAHQARRFWATFRTPRGH